MNKEIHYTKKGKYTLVFDIQKQNTINIFLDQSGVELRIIGKGRLREQKVHTYICVHHTTAQTKADIILRSVLEQKSHLTVEGLIRIDPDAGETQSNFSHKTLMLTSDAYIHTEPNLEIQNNDVSVSHDATISEISEYDIYYLQTRGLKREEAEEQIIRGFLHK